MPRLEQMMIKTLTDVKADMSDLYEQVKSGACDLKLAAELANITGKYLKAVQLEFAREVFTANKGAAVKELGHDA